MKAESWSGICDRPMRRFPRCSASRPSTCSRRSWWPSWRRAPDAAALPEQVFEVSEEARSLGLELDSAAARPIIRLMVGRGLDALAERVTAERVAPIVTRVLGARRL